jgi:AraC-like DNA-binding protein
MQIETSMPIDQMLDILMRGGSLALAALVTFQLLAFNRLKGGALAGVLFMLIAAAYTINSIPGSLAFLGPMYLPLKLAGFLAPNAFLFFAFSLAKDNHKPLPVEWGLLAISIFVFIVVCIEKDHAYTLHARVAHVLLSLGMVVWAMQIAWASYCDDLVESRRRLSRAMMIIIPVTGFVILAFTLMEAFSWPMRPNPMLQSTMVFATLLGFSLSISTVRDEIFALPSEPGPAVRQEGNAPADRIELARLKGLMAERAFLEPGLTIGLLAKRMDVPEHRLRKLINHHLGYRNFAEFINDHRIDEAKQRLQTASFAREQITGLAFDLGFASLAPFNRAFKERVGMSPSEYRTKALTNLLQKAESGIAS